MSIGGSIVRGSGLSARRAEFTLSIGDIALRVVRFSGREGLSTLFEFQLDVAGIDLDPETLLGQPALLTIRGFDEPRLVHGIVSEAAYVGQTRDLLLYELTLTPWAHRLLHQQDCRIFQDQTTEEIITKVLSAAGFPHGWFRFSLSEEYSPRNYCVQYRETHFTFISRLLEEDGIFHFFEHEEDKHVWVMADHAQAHTPIVGDPALSFCPPLGRVVQDREHVKSFRFGGRIRAGKVSLRDFNLHRPDMAMEVKEAGKVGAELEVYDFPGEYQDPGRAGPHQGQLMAKIRLEAIQATRTLGTGESDCPRLQAGRSMILVGHPRHELNGDYRILQVQHAGAQSQVLQQDASEETSYNNSFVLSELKVPFRPAREAPRPVMRGVQTATVVGPEGEEVHTDKHGRVRLQFHWDRESTRDENSATWVRVSQSWAGNGYGSMFIPRIGHEVLVDFIEGDPDRPIVVGRIYHGQNDTPYPLPDEKTKSTIRSESSPGGGGFNELRFEDRKGAEEVFVHAQRDLNGVILNDRTEQVGVNRTAKVGVNDTTVVGAVHTVTIAGASASSPPSDGQTEIKLQDTFYSVTTGAARIVINGPDVYIMADGNITLAAGGNVSINAGGTVDLSSGASTSMVAGGGVLVLKGPLVKIN